MRTEPRGRQSMRRQFSGSLCDFVQTWNSLKGSSIISDIRVWKDAGWGYYRAPDGQAAVMPCLPVTVPWASNCAPTDEERQKPDHQEQEEQDLRNTGRGARDPAKPENRGDDRDHKKY